MKEIILLTKAWNFAAQRHAAQRRKGEAQEPYVNHLAEVAELVAEATGGTDANLVAAAVLVVEVTDDKELPWQVAKDLQVTTAAKKSDRVKVLKLADKTANLRSLA